MAEPSRKKPWSKPDLKFFGRADDVRRAIDSGSAGFTPEMRTALNRLLADRG